MHDFHGMSAFVFNEMENPIRIEDSTFERCVTTTENGAVLRFIDALDVNVEGSTFRDNKAKEGGAISFENVDLMQSVY